MTGLSLAGLFESSLLSSGVGEPPTLREAGPELAELKLAGPTFDLADEDGIWFSANARQALLHLPGVASFLVEDGRSVAVWRPPGHDAAFCRLVLDGTVLGLLLAQRGRFALHANAVDTGTGSAVLIAGDRGAGKSTTTVQLKTMGYTVLADDICPLEVCGDEVRLHPTGRSLRLGADSVKTLGVDPGEGNWEPATDKFLFPVPLPLRSAPPVVSTVVILVRGQAVKDPEAAPADGLLKLRHLQSHLYRAEFLRTVFAAQAFAWAAALAERLSVVTLVRPEGDWSAEAVAGAVIAAAGSGGHPPDPPP